MGESMVGEPNPMRMIAPMSYYRIPQSDKMGMVVTSRDAVVAIEITAWND